MNKNSDVETFAMNNCKMLLAAAAKSATKVTVVDDVEGGLKKFTCKTCGRGFDSFQALGGHRASHKKLRPENVGGDVASTVKPKSHACSICGAEYPIGQALGGHMRRHKPLVTVKKEKVTVGVIPGSGNLSTVTTEVSVVENSDGNNKGIKRKSDEVSDLEVQKVVKMSRGEQVSSGLDLDLNLGYSEWVENKEEIKIEIENNNDDEIEEGKIESDKEEKGEDREFLKLELRQPIRVSIWELIDLFVG